MSFVKVTRSNRGVGKRPARSRKAPVPKQEWVSTIQDLNVHKATPEELRRRHEMHRSQNRAVAQWEMKERALRRRIKSNPPISPAQLNPAQLNIIREVFSDQYRLQDVLARSDRALAVVKDLFGDAPSRQTGFPNVTVAPGSAPDPQLPVPLKPEPQTQLSLLSQSVMDAQALNEVEDVGGEYSEEEADPSSSVTLNSNPDTSRRIRQQARARVRGSSHSPLQTHSAPAQHEALNATVAVRRVRSRQSECSGDQCSVLGQVLNPDPAPVSPGRASRGRCAEASGQDSSALGSQSGNQTSLELLQCMLGEVESELDCLELQEPLSTGGPQLRTPPLTGFSASLLRTVARLARCLRQSAEEVRKEARERRRLEEVVEEQRGLIDALSAETLALREESTALQARLEQRVTQTELQLDTLLRRRGGAGYREQPETDSSSSTRERAQALQYPAVDTRGRCGGERVAEGRGPSPGGGPRLAETPPLLGESQDAVLSQIAELTRQNALIRSQLQQYCSLPAGAASSQQHSTAEREPAATQGRGQQTAPPAGPAVSCVEQRLLELNRQSAAARHRLLGLIERQTRASEGGASPSISPIPPATHNAPADDGGRTPEASALPEQNSSPAASSCGSRLAGGDGKVTSQQSQAGKLKDDGWFALSAHVH
ncbi:spindle and centriole-associated protein 1 [Megalops cyprinoides]|uniref:spindle and centriole-associated protein 1 n=1 Tax=Megalops cyprinoides TaxID=118141 RepID=UPI001864EF8E|nr:spindle and centriole-associated protein 1 [Megalops cyprinoides]